MLQRLRPRHLSRPSTTRLAKAMVCCVLTTFASQQSAAQESHPLRAAVSPAALTAAPATTTPPQENQSIQLVGTDAPIKEETTEAALEVKHERVATQLRVALLQEEARNAEADTNESAAPRVDASEVDLLKQVDVIIAQQKSATATLEDIEAKSRDLAARFTQLESGQLEQSPPYSITLVDQLRDSIKALDFKAESLQASLMAARDAVEQARRMVDEEKQNVRQLRDKNPNADVTIANLEVKLAEELLVLRRQELAIEEANEAVRLSQLQIDQRKLEIASRRIEFSQATLDQQITELDAREFELKRKAESLQAELQFAERRWLAARQEVDSASSPNADLMERVDALKTRQQTLQQELSVANQRLQRLPMIRTSWERRYAVHSNRATREERRLWLKETVDQIAQLARERRLRDLKIAEVRSSLVSVNSKLEAIAVDNNEAKRWLQTKQDALNRQAEILTDGFLAIDSATKALDRLRLEIEGERSRTIKQWSADTLSSAGRIWNYELTSIDDTSLTIGKVVSSVLLLFFGFFAARGLSRLLGKRLPKLGVDEAGASIIESLSFYALLLTFGLTALRYANVPLTAFTFLGGAIAIGVGFGSQNILNNFISGLILLAERPIKVGDLIQLGETYGNVTKIGPRSTQIRTGENLDIIVPNSKFLENDVTNLTRRDDRLRTSICVGVAYGSPLDKVVQLLEQAARDARDVQELPTPMVWFNDFGDNSLVFQVNFWIKARTLAQMRRIETEVRLSIDRLFRAHDIVIAYPQRDLHIQTPRPIDLRLVNSEGDQLLRATG